jgi:hypothetical protein
MGALQLQHPANQSMRSRTKRRRTRLLNSILKSFSLLTTKDGGHPHDRTVNEVSEKHQPAVGKIFVRLKSRRYAGHLVCFINWPRSKAKRIARSPEKNANRVTRCFASAGRKNLECKPVPQFHPALKTEAVFTNVRRAFISRTEQWSRNDSTRWVDAGLIHTEHKNNRYQSYFPGCDRRLLNHIQTQDW